MLDRVLTADKLLQREWGNYFCPMCRRNLKTASHLFTKYPFTVKVWEHMAAFFRLEALKPVRWLGKDLSIQDWYRDMVSTKVPKKNYFPAVQPYLLENMEGAE
jgi:hypothetical protein